MNEKNPQPSEQMPFLRRLQEGFSFVKACPVCKGEYSDRTPHVLYEQDPVHLIHMSCPHCESSILSIVTLSDIGMSSVGVFTDLSADDVVRFHGREAFEDNDILALHEFLSSKDAPKISQLFVR